MSSDVCKQRSCDPKERTMYKKNKNILLCVCLLRGGGSGEGDER